MIYKEIFCAIPIDSDPIDEIEEDLLVTLLEDTTLIHSSRLKETLENIKTDFRFEPTDRPIKVKITIEVEELIDKENS